MIRSNKFITVVIRCIKSPEKQKIHDDCHICSLSKYDTSNMLEVLVVVLRETQKTTTSKRLNNPNLCRNRSPSHGSSKSIPLPSNVYILGGHWFGLSYMLVFDIMVANDCTRGAQAPCIYDVLGRHPLQDDPNINYTLKQRDWMPLSLNVWPTSQRSSRHATDSIIKPPNGESLPEAICIHLDWVCKE